MRVAVFSTKAYDKRFLEQANSGKKHQLQFIEAHLGPQTAALAAGCDAVCVFVNDAVNRSVLTKLGKHGVRLVALRSAGFNNVDLMAARNLGIRVARVPAYSPEAIAEFTLGLILCLNRRIHRSYARVREGNFALDGLLGYNLSGRTIGILGTGKIGMAFARIVRGLGMTILAQDPYPSPELEKLGGTYVDQEELFARSDIVSIHCPLTPETHHLVNMRTIGKMKRGVMIVNTSRGAVINTPSVIGGLKSGHIGALALDVYEEEGDLFFEDLSSEVIKDDVFARLVTFPNVLVTGHQAFFTEEAMTAISETTIANITTFEESGEPKFPVSVEMLA